MLSGYRAFSRQFVKSFPILTTGLRSHNLTTVHALGLRVPISEVDTPYRARPEGSASKLSTYRDGLRILNTIIGLQERAPAAFFRRGRS